MEIQLKIIGSLLMLLALIHVGFPRYFKWKEELSKLSLINKQMMEVHTFFLALTVFLMGLLCVVSTHDLIHTNLGKTISLGFSVFWIIRLYFQFFVYSPDLWKGKRFETSVHVVFIFFWAYLSGVFGYLYFS
ncbi:MAG: hypothetical protein AAGD28_27135 [Bacteroidota bacterium]